MRFPRLVYEKGNNINIGSEKEFDAGNSGSDKIIKDNEKTMEEIKPKTPAIAEEVKALESKEELKPRVLFADDKANQRALMTAVLGGQGYEVDVVTDGKLLVEELRKHSPDYYGIVITDNSMPGGNGIDAIAEIRSMPDFQGLPVILVSGDTHPELYRQLDKLNATSLSKPYNLEDLYSKVEELTQKNPLVSTAI